jgi:predicted molibdopterin-dependent oxidoreductase YjgC
MEAEAWVTDRVPPGMVYANFHFPETPTNALTIAALDPVAKIPEYKVCAVRWRGCSLKANARLARWVLLSGSINRRGFIFHAAHGKSQR